MKYLVIAVSVLILAGCSTTPSKLERIEANEAAISALQAHQHEVDPSCPASCVESIDRAFEKSMIKN